MRSLRSKLPLLLAVAGFVVVLRAAVRQRRILRTLGLFGLQYPGEDVVDFFSGFASSISDAVKDFVLGMIRIALNVVYDVFNAVYDALSSISHVLGSAVDYLKSLINAGLKAVSDTASWLYNQSISYARAIVNDAVSFVGAIISGVRDALQASINYVYDHALSWANYLFDHVSGIITDVANTLWHGIENAFNAAVSIAHSAVDGALSFIGAVRDVLVSMIRGVFDDVMSALGIAKDFLLDHFGGLLDALHDRLFDVIDLLRDDVLGALEDLGSYVWGDVQEIVDVVKKVLDWLIWLAELPFEVAGDIWQAVTSITPRHVMNEIRGASGRVATPFLHDIKGKVR